MTFRTLVSHLTGIYEVALASRTPIRPDHPLKDHPVLGRPRYTRRLSHDGRYRPVMLICETVNICNNDCIICPYSQHERFKGHMPMELFDRVLSEYASIGGGYLSLTPMVGEVFLDRLLAERIAAATACPAIRGVSITTNATHADRYTSAELAALLRSLCKVQISIYGLTAEEHRTFTKRDDHERVLRGVRAIIDACDRPGKVSLSIRLLQPRGDDEVAAWTRTTFGEGVSVAHSTSQYANWGGVFDGSRELPMGATWVGPVENTGQCLIPTIGFQVFVNGDVSFCPCCDYDASPEFALGNIRERSLQDICDSPRVRELWAEGGSLPSPCRRCTFHVPIESIGDRPYFFGEPLRFIGG
jgi:radical SAM protein with 4Fe4S-binding SPASM domain